ncbi:MAG TPA: ABC transporter ATP-binding protein [Micromonosporaceae bacterium]|jgi:ATP-binding cassette subfamily B protein
MTVTTLPAPDSAGTSLPADHEPPRKVSVRRIFALFRPHRWLMTGLLGIVLVRSVVGVISPFLLREILDKGLPERNLALITELAVGMIAAAVVGSALGVWTTQLATVIGQRVMHELRVAVFGHLQRLSLSFFTRTKTGDVLSRVINDVGGVDNVLTNTATSTVASVTQSIAIAVALLIMDWKLALVGIVLIPAYLAVTFRLGGQRRQIARNRQRSMSALTSTIEESLSVPGVVLAKTMGLGPEMQRRFAERSAEISKFDLAAVLAGRWRLATRGAALTIVPAIAYWIAGVEFTHGGSPTTLGTVVAFTSMLNRFVAPASAMQGIGQAASTSIALFGRIFDVLDLPVDITDRTGAGPLVASGGRVEIRGVRFSYEGAETPTLDDINLVVPAGTSTAIVGATGSGKTSLGYLVTRLYEPQAGSITIDGVDIRDISMASLARSVGFVAQETYLLHASVRENLLLVAPDATTEQLEAAASAAHIHDLIAGLPEGYDTLVGERGYRFSGGERQRLAIARMVLRNPPVLVLDEATSALDTRTERAVQAALDELSKGRTTIVIAHRLSTIVRADQIVVLDHGRIVERGTHAELLVANGRYAALART